VGREQPLLGDAGEDLALDLLRRSFLTAAKTRAGAPTDWVCWELRAALGSVDFYPDPTLHFHFQIKSSQESRKFPVSSTTLRSWLELFEYQPVILMFVEPIGVGHQRYWYYTLHDWLMSPQGQAALTTPKSSVTFELGHGFVQSDSTGVNFHDKMIEEAERATGTLSSPWVTLRDYGLYPFDEGAFLKYLELASFAEAPLEISHYLARQGTKVRHVVNELLQGKSSSQNSPVEEWVKELQNLAPQPNLSSFQRQQFRQFTTALMSYEKGIALPPFRIAALSCWRSFVAMYPYSVNMLDHIASNSNQENDLMFTSALLPLLALSTNSAVSDRAWQVIAKLKKRHADFSSYAFQRELSRGAAEAGDKTALAQGIDLITEAESLSRERGFLEGYGWPKEALAANLTRKLSHPTRRDQNLESWYEAMAETLL
jgi:hypothetical protein